MKLSDIALCMVYPFLSSAQKAAVADLMKWERETLKVISVLPMKYSHKQVEAALRVSGATPEMIYMSLASGEPTFVLEQFYEALNHV